MSCINCGKQLKANEYLYCKECLTTWLNDDDKVKEFKYVCNKCGESLEVGIDSDFASIPFEGTWSCKCGNVIRVKWDGKELKYL